MSHFTVLVIGDNPEAQLAPYQENNMCDCPKEYLEFMDEETRMLEDYLNDTQEYVIMPDGSRKLPWDEAFRVSGSSYSHGSDTHRIPDHLEKVTLKFADVYPTFDEYCLDWCGLKERDAEMGRYGYWENPNAKWDWYQIGGRWTGFFKLKNGADGIVGKPGLMTPRAESGYADMVLLGDVDLQGMREEAGSKARANYRKVASVFGTDEVPKLEHTWKSLEHIEDISVRREMYHRQEQLVAINAFRRATKDEDLASFLCWIDYEKYMVSEEEFVQKAMDSALSTFAVLKDGVWYERGKMGFWAVVSNDIGDDWDKQFNMLLEGLEPNTLLTVVDCHI